MSQPFTDVENPATEHRDWCNPSRCLVATIEPSSDPVVLEHVGEPVELSTSEGRFTVDRVQEVDSYRFDLPLPGFIRFGIEAHGSEPAVVHMSAADALDLAEQLRQLADQIAGQR
ncbi:MAG TPA: hypothetical protein VFE65_14835 [Pseudonocardia sp.]|nr:hypothetical protein [Pseudonocardia sp.]